jgi:hypothetical protein
MLQLVNKYALVRGAPDSDEARASLDFALARIRQRLEDEQFQGTLEYDARDLLHNQRWWYIPFIWVGCNGFVVNLDTGYVNWLGSAFCLDLCFWGHEQGLFCDTVDFSFEPDTNIQLAGKLVGRFMREPHRWVASESDEFVRYHEFEINTALTTIFPNFRRHFVWYAIPDLRDACENEGLRFTSTLAEAL